MLSIQNVGDVLAESGLCNPDLPFLSLDPDHIRILMFQPQATVVGDAGRVGVLDRERMTAQMKGFLETSYELSADIALCPEYSCTWDAIVDSVESDIFPAAGKIWALACESATPHALTETLNRLGQRLSIIFDASVFARNGNFVDALCYLFRTTNDEGQQIQVALIQTKTEQMGDKDHFEYSHLKVGDKLYRFRNSNEQSNSLVGLICSDTLHPSFAALVPELTRRTIILHPQMNQNPSSPGFRSYRSACCTAGPRSSEIICLNWAGGTTLEEKGVIDSFIDDPKTILYRDTEQLIVDDQRIGHNHSKGCYLANWETHRTAAFVFSPDPHLFYFETTKPYLEGPATNISRTGPRMLDLFSWNEGTAHWEVSENGANDRFEQFWYAPYPALQPLFLPLLPNRVDLERFVQLSIGYATKVGWMQWNKLESFLLAEDDTAQRLTICWSKNGAGATFRQVCLQLFRGFADVVAKPAQFSARLAAFSTGNAEVTYIGGHMPRSFRNLHLPNDGGDATGIYLGEYPSETKLDEVKKRTQKGLYETGADKQLLAIWYRDDNGLHDFMDRDVPQYNADPGSNPVGIDETAQ